MAMRPKLRPRRPWHTLARGQRHQAVVQSLCYVRYRCIMTVRLGLSTVLALLMTKVLVEAAMHDHSMTRSAGKGNANDVSAHPQY
jgi:hypothetical protein